MEPFTQALEKLGWNPATGREDDRPNLVNMHHVAQDVSENPPDCKNGPDSGTGADFTTACYILAETAPRQDGNDAFIPYMTLFQEQDDMRQALERIIQTSDNTSLEQARMWTQRADQVITRWQEQGY